METSQFENLCMLTIKNPSNTFSKVDLLRVLYTLSDRLFFSMPDLYWFETGKQNQIHIHCIVKKHLTNENIPHMSKTFKQIKTKYTEVSYDEAGEPVLIPRKFDHKSLTFHICPITSKGHYLQLTHEYRFKETDYKADFIEDKPPYTLSSCSLPFLS